ncbi:hypothetical protein Dform_02064 [Dehalogenimonas formicexedens]|uniref:Uncharacterized protein n=1 Tax=Dehalogenimonas formicexedens TaxID=1839801 RepID=A0A1P8FAA0_9CHLR|nr:hypothetical protein [Dehalogenimonas formicexedens]APV45373.1 hypothetical protein Dform_02064 [Dehalogenimonas formicexedens]
MSEFRPLSQVKPVLIAALVCDVAMKDPTTGKISLIGIFDKVHVKQFPAQRPVSLYAKLTEAEGNYQFQAKYVYSNTGETLAEAKGEFTAKDKLGTVELNLQYPPLPITAEGRYDFQLWVNGQFLGQTFIDAAVMA